MDFKRLDELIDGVKLIGDKINQWRNDEQLKKIREPKDFKTEADFKASALLKELIFKYDKNAVVISEEDEVFSINRPNAYWLIDPIDGTASWYEGFDGFVTQVAYIVNTTPVLGIVYAPALKKVWWGLAGQGAFLNGHQLNKPKRGHVDNIRLVDNYPEPRRIAKKLYEGMDNISHYIESGSLGLKSVLVADGGADLFVKDVVIRDWDIAPAYVLLKELDCHLSDLKGKEISFSGVHDKLDGLLVATNSDLANKVIAYIKTKGVIKND